MALPTTSLSFSALQTEFGGSNPISLSEYVRGGAYVPSGTTSSYGTIPTSNSNISLGVFRGTTKAGQLTNGTYTFTTGGGKGDAYRGLYVDGYSSTGGTYQDVQVYYGINYDAVGSYAGEIISGYTPIECVHIYFYSEDSSTGYSEFNIKVVVSGNLTGSRTLYVDGSAVVSAKAGTYDSGTNRTTFRWFEGTQPNSGGTPYSYNDVVPHTSPFGGGLSGTTGNVKTVVLV